MHGAPTVEQLCNDHADLPRQVAARIARRTPLNTDDLEPSAWEGLYLAAATWRPDAGSTFQQWAWQKITGTILDAIRRDRPIPKLHWRRDKAVWEARDRVTARLGRTPTDAEVLAASGLTEAQWASWQRWRFPAMNTVSIDASPFDLPAGGPEQADGLERWAWAAAHALDGSERRVILALFWDGASTAQVAADLGLSESRVSQIKKAAVARMRDAIRWHTARDPGPDLSRLLTRKRAAYRALVASVHEAAPAST